MSLQATSPEVFSHQVAVHMVVRDKEEMLRLVFISYERYGNIECFLYYLLLNSG